MFNALLAMLNSFISVWTANAVVSAAITNLTNYINTLMLADGVRLVGTKGATNAKNLARQTLINFGISHAAAGLSYAVNNNLAELQQLCSLTKSDFTRAKTVELEEMCRNIYNGILPYIANMTSYGATTTSAATFNTAINNYHSLLGTPMAQRSATVAASLTVAQQIDNIDALIKNSLTPLLVQYSSNTTFTNAYASARKINTVGVHHWVNVSCLVTDVHNNPLAGATAKIVELKKRKKHVTKANGKFKFLKLHINTTYTIEVILTGYVTQTFVVNQNSAISLKHTFIMVAGGSTTPPVIGPIIPITA